MPAKSYTNRGFGEYAEFTDVYGAHVVVRQSSLATEDCVWIFANGGGSIRPGTPDRDKATTSPHLNAEMARAVRDGLDEWLRDVEPAAEPFADRARWYPVLGCGGRAVEPDGHRFLFGPDRDDYAAESVLDEYDVDDLEVYVATRSALPTREDDCWAAAGSYQDADVVLFDVSIDDLEDLRTVWLDAVAVANDRNARAEGAKS